MARARFTAALSPAASLAANHVTVGACPNSELDGASEKRPWEFFTALDNAVSTTAAEEVANSDLGDVLDLCVLLAGSAPNAAGAHMCLASDAYPFCRAGASIVVRPLQPGESEDACSKLLHAWSEAERVHKTSTAASKLFEFVSGCPIRFQVGGVRGSRLLGIFPLPAPLQLWCDLSALPVLQCGSSFDVSCWRDACVRASWR